ncbi:MAG: hypothetical protein WA838_09280, partial [Xanthobacteraceae bacterium]
HDYRNIPRGSLRRINGGGPYRDDDVDLAANQFCRQFGKAGELALCRSDLDLDILALDITKITECLAKWPHGFWATDKKYADAVHTLALLRVRGERPNNCHAAEKRD